MLVGEAPGADEDLLGEPFVGRCGDLLTKMLTDLGIDRENVYITNTVKCRPVEGKKNRPPKKEEIQSCKNWLWKEIQEVAPKVIVTFGKVPTSLLLKISKHKLKLGDVVGRFCDSHCSRFRRLEYQLLQWLGRGGQLLCRPWGRASWN